jgi:hypothetical protein
VGIEAGNHGQRRELDPCLRALLSHALLQLIAVGLDASTELGGVHCADAAELELGPAPICDDIAGGAAIDEVHAGRRVGNVVGLVVRSLLPELVSQRADKPDGACGVFDRVDTLRGEGGVGGHSVNAQLQQVDRLVTRDHPHVGWLADDAGCRPDSQPGKVLDHPYRAQATDLLVVGQHNVHRLPKRGPDEVRQGGQDGADEALHVTGAAAEEPPVADLSREGVGVPVLAVHRHRVGVSGQRDPAAGAPVVRGDGDDEVGLCPVAARQDGRRQAVAPQLFGDEVDELAVRPPTCGVQGHQAFGPVQGRGHIDPSGGVR